MRAAPTRERGFTLVEILVAMGILAFGITAALALFALATTTHKRAIDRVTAALLAESIIEDLEPSLTLSFDHTTLPVAEPPPDDPDEEAAPPPAPPAPAGSSGGTPAPAPPVEPPAETRLLVAETESTVYPGYRYEIYLTPLDEPPPGGGPPPAAFLVEVVVRWGESGRPRQATFHSVLLRRVSRRDLLP